MAQPITHWLRRAPLGSGSFGKVSLAIDLDNGVYFAVKSIQSAGSVAEESALKSELAILQSLHSPRIVSCLGADFSFESGASGCNLFLEYMDGGSIAELVKKSGGCLGEMRAQCYARAIVEGLAYLHEQGIVHCDIKGQNILVGSCGVKIADFGAAKKLSAHAGAHEFKGTPLWMAPEVVRGEEQGCASDIWSLGCTVVEMLQGTTPWAVQKLHASSSSVSHVASTLFKIGYSLENPPMPEGFSAECCDFLSKALQRDLKLRWTAAQLLNHPWLQDAPSFESYCSPQPSPRSALDFPESDSDVEGEHDSWDTVPVCSPPLRPIGRKVSGVCPVSNPTDGATQSSTSVLHPRVYENCHSRDCDVSHVDSDNVCILDEDCIWITVRCALADSESRQKPFMRKPMDMHIVQRPVKLNLDALAFLRQRRSRG